MKMAKAIKLSLELDWFSMGTIRGVVPTFVRDQRDNNESSHELL